MIQSNRILSGLVALGLLLSASCKGSQSGSSTPATISTAPAPTSSQHPQFNADSAYSYVDAQCAFGPRVPGTEAHSQCGDWLEQELARHGATVKVQRGEMKTYDGKTFMVRNILGSFNPEAKMRVLLMSHWDCRPCCDADPDPAHRHEPVMGANDGASGVGVLLELARLCQQQPSLVGFDILFDDLEDYGAPNDWQGTHDEKWWAMGTQLWCRQAAKEGYRAQYGILLDMVGSPNATFYREYYSERYARNINDEVWSSAARLGYGDLFIDQQGGGVTDDHVFVNRMLHLPMIDIIDYRMESEDTGFSPVWHTSTDTMDNISKETLRKVGTVLVQMLW